MPDRVTELLRLSGAYFDVGNLGEAGRLLAIARRLNPHDPFLAQSEALLLVRMGDSRAVGILEGIIADHDNDEVRIILAAACLRFGDLSKAYDAFAKAFSGSLLRDPHGALRGSLTTLQNSPEPGSCALIELDRIVLAFKANDRPRTVRVKADGLAAGDFELEGKALPELRLSQSLARAESLELQYEGSSLLGSPFNMKRIRSIEGIVWDQDGDLHGWAHHPHAPSIDPSLTITALATGAQRTINCVFDRNDPVPHIRFNARPRRFMLTANDLLDLPGLLDVRAISGQALYGSPIDPGKWQADARKATILIAETLNRNKRRAARNESEGDSFPDRLMVPANVTLHRPYDEPQVLDVDVVVPVYGARDITLRCVRSVLKALPQWARLVVVDDASPDAQLLSELRDLATDGRIQLIRHKSNQGFPGAANTGLGFDQSRDIVLLNSDTLVAHDWLSRLRTVAYSSPDIGTVTPLSNDATILSYPEAENANRIPGPKEVSKLDKLAFRVNSHEAAEIPTAVGFCTYIRRACLDEVGPLRTDVFAQGYGEENDFCLRARHLGWRHVAAPGIYVGHVGGQSFGAAKQHLISRNIKILNTLHPGYDVLIQEFIARDPLAQYRKRIDAAVWRSFRDRRPSVILVTHGRAGGIRRHVAERAAALEAVGVRPIVLWPFVNSHGMHECVLGNGPLGGTPNLRFTIPEQIRQLAQFLTHDKPRSAEIHSLIGHQHEILRLFSKLNIPYSMIVHDYALFCPRISLVTGSRQYCGEPAPHECEACVADNGSLIEEEISVRDLLRRSRHELQNALSVVAPSRDAAIRIQRHFPGIEVKVDPWEDDGILTTAPGASFMPGSRLRVAIIGAISIEKGYDILLGMARDAEQRELPIEFVVIGFTLDDDRLLNTGRVTITGEFAEAEATRAIQEQNAHCAFFPAIWPETWSYTLSQAWQAGLDVIAFDLGAPAERIRRANRGSVIPLGMPPKAINAQLLQMYHKRFAPATNSRSAPQRKRLS